MQKNNTEKGYKEGHHLMFADHVDITNISRCLKYCFIRDNVVSQTTASEISCNVWVWIDYDNREIVTAECGCVLQRVVQAYSRPVIFFTKTYQNLHF